MLLEANFTETDLTALVARISHGIMDFASFSCSFRHYAGRWRTKAEKTEVNIFGKVPVPVETRSVTAHRRKQMPVDSTQTIQVYCSTTMSQPETRRTTRAGNAKAHPGRVDISPGSKPKRVYRTKAEKEAENKQKRDEAEDKAARKLAAIHTLAQLEREQKALEEEEMANAAHPTRSSGPQSGGTGKDTPQAASGQSGKAGKGGKTAEGEVERERDSSVASDIDMFNGTSLTPTVNGEEEEGLVSTDCRLMNSYSLHSSFIQVVKWP
jgi:hypothetical protein